MLYLGYVRLVLLQNIGDRPLLLLATLQVVLAIQFLSIGLLGEMIVRAASGRAREAYRVREELNAPAPATPGSSTP